MSAGNNELIDNWSLQNIGEALTNGLDDEWGEEVEIDVGADGHSLVKVSKSIIQIEALFDLLTSVVLQDELFCDKDFVDSWAEYAGCFSLLTGSSLLSPTSFEVRMTDVAARRSALISYLCPTSSLRSIQRENERSYEEDGQATHQVLGQVMWGTAGMLARADILEVPYSGHPLRKSYLQQLSLLHPTVSARERVLGAINSTRTRILRYIAGDLEGQRVSLLLPPIPLLVIREAGALEDLIPIAVELREHYKPLRQWIAKFQVCLDSEDIEGALKRTQVVENLEEQIMLCSRGIESSSDVFTNLCTGQWKNATKQAASIALEAATRHVFRARAQLSELALAPAGYASLEKLLAIFGEDKSKIGRETLELAARRFS